MHIHVHMYMYVRTINTDLQSSVITLYKYILYMHTQVITQGHRD